MSEDSSVNPLAKLLEGGLDSVAPDLLNELANFGSEPKLLGAYQVIATLGRGGMGVVYKAQRIDGEYQQDVALKLLPGAFTDTVSLRRFQRERQILAQLNHPNIATLLDGGTTNEGQPFLVMELVDGVNLVEGLQGESIENILDSFESVLAAVAAAQSQGIIHADLKPNNVMLSDEGQVKLLDFGIAKVLDIDAGEEEVLQTGSYRALTPGYAAPEQLLGEPITTATDVYQLGLLFYELLGNTAAQPITDRSASGLETAICDTVPLPPSALNSKLSGDLDAIVMKALHKEPGQRYSNAAALLTELQTYRQGFPVSAKGNFLSYRLRKFFQRNRVWAGAGSLAIAAILIGGFSSYQQFKVAQREAAVSTQTANFLMTLFANVDPKVAGNEDPTLFAVVEGAAERLDEELADQPMVRAEAKMLLGTAMHNLRRYEEGQELHAQALALFTSQDPDNRRIPELLSRMGLAKHELGDFEGALESTRLALSRSQELGLDSVSETAQLHGNIGRVLLLRQPTEAIHHYQTALQLIADSGEFDTRTLAEINGNLASAYYSAGEVQSAIASTRTAITLLESLGESRSADILAARGNLANFLLSAGEFSEAEQISAKALEQVVARFGPKSLHTASASMLMGTIYLIQGKLGLAEELTGKAYQITQHLPDRSYIPLATTINYASVLLLTNESELAVQKLRAKVKSVEQSWPPEHLYSGRFFALLAKAELDAGNIDSALEYGRKANLADFSSRPDYHARALATIAELALHDQSLTSAELMAAYEGVTKAQQLISGDARIPRWSVPELEWLQAALQHKLGNADASAVALAKQAFETALPLIPD